MSNKKSQRLPDIDDAVFKARLAPLAEAVLPHRSSVTEQANRVEPENQGVSALHDLDNPYTGDPVVQAFQPPSTSDKENCEDGQPGQCGGSISAINLRAAIRIEETRERRGPRKGVEFLLPDRVMKALRTEAAQSGVSMSVKLLEILRDAGYPVIEEDFIDLRRLPKR